jgi:hypothetical protein
MKPAFAGKAAVCEMLMWGQPPSAVQSSEARRVLLRVGKPLASILHLGCGDL